MSDFSNLVLERIHQVLGNLVCIYNINKTYVDEDNLRLVILSVAEFVVIMTTNRLKSYSPGQYIFGSDMIILIKHIANCELLRHQKQTKPS